MRFLVLFALFIIAPLSLAGSCLAEGDGLRAMDEAYILSAPPGDPPAGNDPATRSREQTSNSLGSFFAFDPSSRRGLTQSPSDSGPILQRPAPNGHIDWSLQGQRSFFAFDPSYGGGQGFSPGFGPDPFQDARRQ